MARGNAKKAGKKKADKTPRPRKKPENIRKEAKQKAAAKRAKKQRGKAGPAQLKAVARSSDPSATDEAEARFIQPYQATKVYRCPGCHREIAVGVGHMVSVPPEDPGLRRHWHRGCWNNRHNLR